MSCHHVPFSTQLDFIALSDEEEASEHDGLIAKEQEWHRRDAMEEAAREDELLDWNSITCSIVKKLKEGDEVYDHISEKVLEGPKQCWLAEYTVVEEKLVALKPGAWRPACLAAAAAPLLKGRAASGAAVDAGFARDVLRDEALLEYVHALVVAPRDASDKLDHTIAAAQLKAFNRWRGKNVLCAERATRVAAPKRTARARGQDDDVSNGGMVVSASRVHVVVQQPPRELSQWDKPTTSPALPCCSLSATGR
ncbi:hypothetical protein ZWY2020_028323 [Hordeum vulgare]|nr:hypothetical protein ZWY2020_028323 [Hordeum vulgare]